MMSEEPGPATEQTVSQPKTLISDEVWEAAQLAWVNEFVRNSPISGATEAWNHLHMALPHLRTYLETELAK
jgi:hypothetical protein